MPFISAFMERYPEIQLDLDFTDRMVDVIDEGFDVVIRGSELQDSRLMSRQLGPYRACLVASPAYLQNRGIPTKPADLLNHSCLHYRWQNSGKLYQWPFKRQQAIQAGEALPVTMVCSNVEALIYLAQSGRGIACLPDFAVNASLADGRLEKVLSSSLVGVVPFTSSGPVAGRWRLRYVHLWTSPWRIFPRDWFANCERAQADLIP